MLTTFDVVPRFLLSIGGNEQLLFLVFLLIFLQFGGYRAGNSVLWLWRYPM
jgi:hypothetical protein